MEKYLDKLVEQFKNATGTKNVDVNSPQFIQEFREWVKSREMIGRGYGEFIGYMNVQPTIGESSVEIGKGKHDSIVLDKDILMITPYSEGLDRRIITADFRVYDATPVIIRHYKDGNQLQMVNTQHVRRFITQNPYEQSCISNWEQLHNRGDNITVGIFGSIYDKDIESKIRQIQMLRDGIYDGSYKEEHSVEGDRYYYAISSTRKVKCKVLTR